MLKEVNKEESLITLQVSVDVEGRDTCFSHLEAIKVLTFQLSCSHNPTPLPLQLPVFSPSIFKEWIEHKAQFMISYVR